MELKPDTVISHYRLIEKIGAGGMGIVWSALDTRLKRNVAIKILPLDLTADTERRLRFQREAQTAAGLSHPNIAVIHEVGEHENVPFLVMELLEGKTLRDTVGKRALPVKQWLEYGLAIAGALAHAHKNGVVHRDLKSANVMVTADGHVKLLDFGLAKLLEPKPPAEEAGDDNGTRLETISRELTQAGKVLGTVAYMSPEQARGDAVDHRSDIFSFGVLLYELATGNLPFKGNTDIESLNATLSHDPPTLSQIVGEVPADAERIVTKALEKERGRRYQHADDIVTDFRNLKRDLDTGRVTIPSRGSGVTGAVPSAGASGPTAAGPTGAAPTASGAGGLAAMPVKPWIIAAVTAIVLLAVTLGILQRRSGDDVVDAPGGAPGDGSAVVTPDHSTPAGSDTQGGRPGATQATRIVVLPFENLGPSQDEYFASGVTEEIIGRLASVRDLAVISRSSAFQYERSGKTMQQIGQDFGVDYILDGTVRWARSGDASRVRIAPELVRVADDTGVWGETYDSPMDDIFQVQTDIAGKVIDALGVVLLAGDRASLEATPTENQEAYRAYLRGTDALIKTPTSELAQQMFERAVELDPTFYQAWAGLSRAHSWRYHGGDRTSGRCESAKKAADEALRLAPGAPEARMALGLYYYRCFRDYKRALAEVEIAERDRPNDTDVIGWKATFHKRQGNLREAARLHRRALELDPMDLSAAGELGVVHRYLREYPESEAALDLAISIAPDVPGPYLQKALTYYRWKGTAVEARAAFDAMPATGLILAKVARFWLEYYDGRYQDALTLLDEFPDYYDDQTTLNVRAALAALCYDAMGEAERARASRQAAAVLLQEKVQENPEDFRPHSDLGPVLAALERREEALAAARRAMELMPPEKDAEAAVAPAENFALTYAWLEDYDAAFDRVEERLAAIPGSLSVPLMRLDPRWKVLVGQPRFDELARRYDISR